MTSTSPINWLLATTLVGAALVTWFVPGQGRAGGQPAGQSPHEARLEARPGLGGTSCRPGVHTLTLGSGRRALMRVTGGGTAGKKALLLALHGAGGGSKDGLWAFRAGWSAPGLVLVAPASEGSTWDIFRGPDLDSIDRALKRAFARCRIDPRRIAVGGFSDGATTALSLGALNGDLFRAVIALSPGGIVAARPVGKPRFFIAHGTRDTVLPFRISDELVHELRALGYSVTFRRFDGGHEVPYSISRTAVRWFLRA